MSRILLCGLGTARGEILYRMGDWLAAAFSQRPIVFLDSQGKEEDAPGLRPADLLVVVIGQGDLFLHDTDTVAVAIQAGLANANAVLPVCVHGVAIPSPERLPAPLQRLSFQDGLVVRGDPDFLVDMQRLIHIIRTPEMAKRASLESEPPAAGLLTSVLSAGFVPIVLGSIAAYILSFVLWIAFAMLAKRLTSQGISLIQLIIGGVGLQCLVFTLLGMIWVGRRGGILGALSALVFGFVSQIALSLATWNCYWCVCEILGKDVFSIEAIFRIYALLASGICGGITGGCISGAVGARRRVLSLLHGNYAVAQQIDLRIWSLLGAIVGAVGSSLLIVVSSAYLPLSGQEVTLPNQYFILVYGFVLAGAPWNAICCGFGILAGWMTRPPKPVARRRMQGPSDQPV